MVSKNLNCKSEIADSIWALTKPDIFLHQEDQEDYIRNEMRGRGDS